MNLYKYTYQGETYEFRMSNKARIAVEEIQNNALKGLSDPDVARAALAAFKVGNEQNSEPKTEEDHNDTEVKEAVTKTEEEKQLELVMEFAPYMDKISNVNGDIDAVEIGYILLHSLSKYKSLTHEMYDEIVEAMEEEKGFEEVQMIFREMKDKVFTAIQSLNNPKKKGRKTSKSLMS